MFLKPDIVGEIGYGKEYDTIGFYAAKYCLRAIPELWHE